MLHPFRLLLSITLLLAAFPATSQVPDTDPLETYRRPHTDSHLLQSYWQTFQNEDTSYRCKKLPEQRLKAKAVNDRTFDSLLRPLISNVFIGNNGLAINTTAASFTQDKEKGTVSLNYAHLAKGGAFNVGAFAQSKDGIFGLYTKNSWASSVGLTLGWSFLLTPRSFFFDTSNCKPLVQKRRSHVIQTLQVYKELFRYDTTRLKDSVKLFREQLEDWMTSKIPPPDYLKVQRKLGIIDSILQFYRSVVPNKTTGEKELVKFQKNHLDSLVNAWELKNADIFHGYRLWWISINGGVSSDKMSLATDSLTAAQKKAYDSKNLPRTFATVSFNGQTNLKKVLWHFNVGFSFHLSNYLNHPLVEKPGVRYDSTTARFQVFNKNENYHADFDDLKANIIHFQPNFNGAVFFWKAKQFGWNLRADALLPSGLPSVIKESGIYPSTYNLLTGPLFRLDKDKSLSAGTVGLDVGISGAPFKGNGWDYYTFRLNIGIPFNALIK